MNQRLTDIRRAQLDQLLAGDANMAGGGLLKAAVKAAKPSAKMFSAIDKALESSKRGAGTGMEFANELAKTGGIKKAELVDRGIMVQGKEGPVLNPALTQLPKMSKQEFASHLNEKYKPPGVRKLTLGEIKNFNDLSDKELHKEYVRIRGAEPEAYDEPMSRADIIDELENALDEDATDSKYFNYTLPGGQNYRENLYQYADPKDRSFNSPHWDEPNVLYHMRQTDRIEPTYNSAQIEEIGQRMADSMGVNASSIGSGAPSMMMRKGVITPLEAAQYSHAKGFRNMEFDLSPAQKKALHIEEIQSDWHQQGRESGYAPLHMSQQIEEAKLNHRKLKERLEDAKGYSDSYERKLNSDKPLYQDPEVRQRMQEAKEKYNNEIMDLMPQVMQAEAKHQDLLSAAGKFVPDAPFKKNWHEHALKQALMDAAEGGYNQLLITPGEEQAKRYSLSKHINGLQYDPQSKHLIAAGDKGEVINKIVEPHELPSYIGKEVTEKLLSTLPLQGRHHLTGINLQTGGEGMAGFYDKMLPSYLNDIGKKYGVKVGQTSTQVKPSEGYQVRNTQNPDSRPTRFMSATDAANWRRANNFGEEYVIEPQPAVYETLHSFDITPEMREDILNNGLPMYKHGGLAHLAGGGRADSDYTLMGAPRQDNENKPYPKTERINLGVKAVKSGLDKLNRLIDTGPSVGSVLGNVVGAVPFVGPDLRKGMEDSTLTIPYEFQRSATNPRVATGVNTAKVPTTDILDAMKMSDLTGGTGASNLLGSVGKGYAPNPMDVLDTLGLGVAGYGAAKGAGRGALKAARAGERIAEKAVPRIMERGGLGAEMLGALGQNTASNVVKETGGNWLGGEVEKQLKKLQMGDTVSKQQMDELKSSIDTAKRVTGRDATVDRAIRQMENELDVQARNNALNAWMESNLTNYVKKQMGTADDPVRKLAEQDILHMEPFGNADAGRLTMKKRAGLGYPYQGVGESDKAKFWERLSDAAIDPYPAGSYKHGSLDESILANNPWLQKVPDETMINSAKGLTRDLGFDHIIDVLRQDLREGRIRPEQLNKVSMEQAVRRTYEYDQEMAKKMRESQAKVTEGMPVHKEYPEGYKWIELTKPTQKVPEGFVRDPGSGYYDHPDGRVLDLDLEGKKTLEEALKYEGDTMGHCVGGYCPDVIEGRSRIYSLRDAKGEPHVTVEVKPHANYEEAARILETDDPTSGDIARLVAEGKLPGTQRITQIKGKGNRAPKEEYLPFVQDFVKSGNWSEVGDFRNTGLIRKSDLIDKFSPDELDAVGAGEYLTKAEHDDLLLKALRPPEQGMAGGGSVGLKNALNNLLRTDKPEAHMSLGGAAAKAAAKAAKAAAKVEHPLVFPRAVPKSLEDIRPIAQRIAEQMTGEFVRQHPNPKVSTNPAGKSRKQFEREQNIPMETRNLVPPANVPVLDYEKKMGNVLLGVPGDPTLGGVLEAGSLENVAKPTVELIRVGDVTPEYPVPLFGGPRYGDDKRFWASNYGAAVPIQNRADKLSELYESPILGQYIKMAPDSANFALHNLDALLAIQQPEKLSKAKMAKLNREIKAGSPKYGKFPGFIGFEDPIDVLLQSQLDSNLRKHIAETLTKPTITDDLGLANGLDVVAAISHPELRNMEAGVSGFSIGELRPNSDLKMSLGEHPTYDTNIPGALIGQSKYPVPSEIAFPDTTAYARSRMTPGVQEFNMLKMLGPRERIDQQYIDEIKMYEQLMKQYTGKKKGGLAQTKKVKRHGNTVPH